MQILKYIGSFALGAIIFSIGTGIIVYNYFNKTVYIPKEKIKIVYKSGAKIDHDNFKVKDKKLIFDTKADGKGEIETQIPIETIPEAYNWLHKNNILLFGMGVSLSPYTTMYNGSVGYMRRWGSFGLGGEVFFGLGMTDRSKYNVGLNIKSFWMFK